MPFPGCRTPFQVVEETGLPHLTFQAGNLGLGAGDLLLDLGQPFLAFIFVTFALFFLLAATPALFPGLVGKGSRNIIP
jgi:hypothetical protein